MLAAEMDYTPLSMDLTFNTAVTSQTVAVTIMDDLVVERSEIINLTLTSTDPAVISNPSTSTITIEDVDSKLLDVGYCRYECNLRPLSLQWSQLDSTEQPIP